MCLSDESTDFAFVPFFATRNNNGTLEHLYPWDTPKEAKKNRLDRDLFFLNINANAGKSNAYFKHRFSPALTSGDTTQWRNCRSGNCVAVILSCLLRMYV